MKYRLLCVSSGVSLDQAALEMEKEVNQAIAQGWILYGRLSYQAPSFGVYHLVREMIKTAGATVKESTGVS